MVPLGKYGRNILINPQRHSGEGTPKGGGKEVIPKMSVSGVGALVMSGLAAEPRLTLMEASRNQPSVEKWPGIEKHSKSRRMYN